MTQQNGYGWSFVTPSEAEEPTLPLDLDYPKDNTTYLQDKNCVICSVRFKKLKPRRHCCFYCYRGVCDNCSQQKTFNKDLSRSVRTCDYCVKDLLNQGNSAEKEKVLDVMIKLDEQINKELEEISRHKTNSIIMQQNYEYIESDIQSKLKITEEYKIKLVEKLTEKDELAQRLERLEEESGEHEEFRKKTKSRTNIEKGNSEKYAYLRKKAEQIKFENKSLSNALQKIIDKYKEYDNKKTELHDMNELLYTMNGTKTSLLKHLEQPKYVANPKSGVCEHCNLI